MQHVILARDRRKKKSRLKGLLFLMALLSLAIGIVLAIKNQPSINQPVHEQYVELDEQSQTHKDDSEKTAAEPEKSAEANAASNTAESTAASSDSNSETGTENTDESDEDSTEHCEN